jgi:replicative superfamily II helicase
MCTRYGEEFRPVKLIKEVRGYTPEAEPNGEVNPFRFDGYLKTKVPEILEDFSKQKPTLIVRFFWSILLDKIKREKIIDTLAFSFVRTKRVASIQLNISKTEAGLSRDYRPYGADVSDFQTNYYRKFKRRELAELIHKHGIGYHHAGLNKRDRSLVEELYLKGYINILCNILANFKI